MNGPFGLVLARTLVENWGGAIGVQSQPERGNTLLVWLPGESEPRALSNNAGEGTVGPTAFDASA
jgi:signal transduction histidine kinase